jgi:hypothetical protein
MAVLERGATEERRMFLVREVSLPPTRVASSFDSCRTVLALTCLTAALAKSYEYVMSNRLFMALISQRRARNAEFL